MIKTLIFMALAVLLASCASRQEEPKKPTVGMANPASVYCEKIGGKLNMITTDKGVTGYCTLPGGERIEEWALYRQNNK